MTGRRLYELFCDGWASTGEYWRAPERDSNLLKIPRDPVAWPFLSGPEKRAFNHAASRLKADRR